MIRLAARRLWTRRLQALAPLVALLAATLGFQAVLVSARSTQSHVQGVIAANWNPPYDLLVRPPSLVTGLKLGDRLAQPSYLLTAKGGITVAQVTAVREVAGVSVAAPAGIVAIEYLAGQSFAIDASALPRTGDLNAYRITTKYTTDGGKSSISGPNWYVIVEGSQPPYANAPSAISLRGVTIECGATVWCFSPVGLQVNQPGDYLLPPWNGVRFPYPQHITVPVVAVDPAAEDALTGLHTCISSGRALTGADDMGLAKYTGAVSLAQLPVLLNATPGFDESIKVKVEQASSASLNAIVPSFAALKPFDTVHGRYPYVDGPNLDPAAFTTVRQFATSLNQAWNGTLGVGFSHGDLYYPWVDKTIDTTVPLTFSGSPPALTAHEALGTSSGFVSYVPLGGEADDAPYESQDATFRTLANVAATGNSRTATTPFHQFNVVGRYNSDCLAAGNGLAGSGYDLYGSATTEQPGAPNMGPNGSMTNFVAPMPEIMTNLAGGRYLSNPRSFFQGPGDAFLSVIRVRVSDTSVPGPASQARLQQVASAIHRRTGLAVDIIKGSSTQSVAVALPHGYLGRPDETVTQHWLTENVAITFFNAINSTTVVMAIVVTVVAVLLTMQTTYATVRRRRSELVLLRAVGWPSWRLALVMELEVVGLGVLVALIALLAAAFMILVNHPGGGVEAGILLASPAAIALTAFAGLGPALTASRTRPLAALRGPGRLGRRRRRLIQGPFTLGIREALTTWRWQTLIGAIATAVGAMFLGAVLAIVHDFHTSLDSTALAQQLANEVGPFDILLGVLAVILGATTAVSVVLVATRERLPHFATLRALGWSRAKVARVVAGQALAVGLLGGVLGVIALSVVANRVKTGIALTISSQLSPLVLGAATGIAAAIGAVRLVYRRVIVAVLRVG